MCLPVVEMNVAHVSRLLPVIGNKACQKNNIPMKDEVVTFAEQLRKDGYATSYLGKWHLDGKGYQQFAPQRKFGFEDNRFMRNGGHWKKMAQNEDGSPKVGATNHTGKPTGKLDDADDKSFTTDWLADRALEILERDFAKPFCMMVSIPDPHSPNFVRKPYDTMFSDLPFKAPRTKKTMPEGTLPSWRSSENKNGGKKFDTEQMSGYFGMVKCIDDNVGRILQWLEKKALERIPLSSLPPTMATYSMNTTKLIRGSPSTVPHGFLL